MELYVTKKLDTGDDFSLISNDTLPYMHIITPSIMIKRDASGNYYISESSNETTNNSVTNLMKLKKIICKQGFKRDGEDKFKQSDDIVWIKPSPMMFYKKEQFLVPCNKFILNYPVQLQLSCKAENIYSNGKPYNVYNMFWTVDYVIVDKQFELEMLN